LATGFIFGGSDTALTTADAYIIVQLYGKLFKDREQTKRHRLWLLNENLRKQCDPHLEIEFDFDEIHIH